MLHGSETWPIRNENEVALQRAEMRMIRWMTENIFIKLGVHAEFSWFQKVTNKQQYTSSSVRRRVIAAK